MELAHSIFQRGKGPATHDIAANDDESGSFSDAEVARVTLELDRQITRYRRAGAMHHLVEDRPLSLPVKPTRMNSPC
ncbi:hypothetical protein AWB68_06942 [Caballeronia choica]|uniref:Uncharacterized protein n=1 Tax=Caballeronia choica TaxID=326476 RepID=A0A158KQW9_9BURK|nr:hypothetical protein AWB68_06942 [Caballeronia choica]